MQRLYANTSAIFLVILTMVVLGIAQLSNLPIGLYPQTSKPTVYVGINTGTTSGQEFQTRYGREIEQALMGIAKVIKVEGNYYNGFTRFVVQYDWGVDSDSAKREIRLAVAMFEEQFPRDWGRFWVWYSGADGSRAMASLFSDKIAAEELGRIVQDRILPLVERIDGVASAFVTRFDQSEIIITLHPDALLQYSFSVGDVISRLQALEHNRSLGRLEAGSGSYQVTIWQADESTESIESTIIGMAGGLPVRLEQIASIEQKNVVPRNYFRANGKRGLIIGADPKPDANIKKVSDEFFAIVAKQATEIDESLEALAMLNPSKFINEAIDNVISAVLLGMVIATIVVFLFLGSFRDTLVICASIPLSLIGGFILMRVIGIEVNLISLGAMALAVGMVIDGAVVVLENVIRHLEADGANLTTARQRLEVITRATAEVRLPLIASLLTTIIVFAPLPFTSPLTSAILGDLASVMVCVLSVSLLVTLVIIPALIYAVGYSNRGDRKRGFYFFSHQFTRFFAWTHRCYLYVVDCVLRSRKASFGIVLAVILGVFTSGWLMFTQIDREVMAKPYTDKVFLHVNLRGEDIDIERVDAEVTVYEQDLLARFGKDLTHTVSQIREGGGWILVFLKDPSEIDRVKKDLEDYFKNTPAVTFRVSDWTPTSLEVPQIALLDLTVMGANEDDRRSLLQKISEKLSSHDAVGWVQTKPDIYRVDDLRISLDRVLTGRISTTYGDVERDVADVISLSLGDRLVKELHLDGEKTPVSIRLPDGLVKSPDDIGNLLVRAGDHLLPLKTVLSIDHVSTWGHYYSENGKDNMSVKVWPKESFTGDLRLAGAELTLMLEEDPSVDLSLIGFSDPGTEVNENIYSLVLALIISLALIALVVCFQFGGLMRTGLIILAIPFGFIGVGFSLWTFGSVLNVNSMLGLILLCGTSVNNSILFVDFYLKVKERHAGNHFAALLETANLRFRPIMITNVTTILGMLPLAAGMGSGGEVLRPLGIAISGGLWLSAFLTLVILPLAIYLVEKVKDYLDAHSPLARALSAVVGTSLIMMALLPSTDTDAVAIKPLSLNAAEQSMLANHPDLAAAREDIVRKQAENHGLLQSFLPRVSVSREYSEQRMKFDANGDSFVHRSGVNTFSIVERIDEPFRQYHEWQIKRHQTETSQSVYRELEHELRMRLRVAYFTVLSATSAVTLAEENLREAQETVKISQNRFERGFIPETDFIRAQLTFANQEVIIFERKEALRQAWSKLSLLLGIDHHCPCVLVDKLPSDFKFFRFDEGQWLSLAESFQNESIKQLELAKDQAELALRQANLDFLPSISAGISYVRNDPSMNEGVVMSDGPRVFVAAEWQLFSGFANYNQRRVNAAQRSRAEYGLISRQRQLHADLQQAIHNLKLLKHQYQIANSSFEGMRRVLEESRRRFAEGLVNSKQVTDDFGVYLEAQESRRQVVLRIIEAVAHLAMLRSEPEIFSQLL